MFPVQHLQLMKEGRGWFYTITVVAFGAAIIAALPYFFGEKEYKSDRFLMDTLVGIRAYGRDEAQLKGAVIAAYAEMQRIADLSDRFPAPGSAAYKASDVCLINENAGIRPVRVHREIIDMLLLAKRFHTLSGGAFDVTIGPVMDLWGFAGENPKVPSPGKIPETLSLVDDGSLLVNEKDETVFLARKGMKLDLGAVAKGYASESAVRILKERGVARALIDAGGNIRAIGRKSGASPWKIGVKDPREEGGIIAIIPLEDGAAVTSGDYYRYFESGGKRYHHILDPRSGYPASANMSVTVVTKDAGAADCLSTVFFVLGPERSIELAERMKGVDLFIVTTDRRILHTRNLRGRVEVMGGGSYRYDKGR
jgi:FAD:protein FMN transferase